MDVTTFGVLAGAAAGEAPLRGALADVAVFLAGDFPAVDFAGDVAVLDLRGAAFLTAPFLTAACLVEDFLVEDFLVEDFLVEACLAGDFLVEDFLAEDFLAGAFFATALPHRRRLLLRISSPQMSSPPVFWRPALPAAGFSGGGRFFNGGLPGGRLLSRRLAGRDFLGDHFSGRGFLGPRFFLLAAFLAGAFAAGRDALPAAVLTVFLTAFLGLFCHLDLRHWITVDPGNSRTGSCTKSTCASASANGYAGNPESASGAGPPIRPVDEFDSMGRPVWPSRKTIA